MTIRQKLFFVCLVVGLMFIGFASVVVAAKFSIGDTVKVIAPDGLNVRTGAGTNYLEITDSDYHSYAPLGTKGKILSGPTSANNYIWWKVDYGPGLYSGWSVEGGLEKVQQIDSMTFDNGTVDVTIPDGTEMSPEKQFTKTWRIKNNGNTNWNGYKWGYVSGQIAGHTSINLSSGSEVSVPQTTPGNWVNIPVSMTAPTTPGTYYSYWQIQNSNGTKFGEKCYVKIVVKAIVDTTSREEKISKIIQEEKKEQVIVFIGNQKYKIVTLKRYIDTDTLQCSDSSGIIKVYVNDNYTPIKDIITLQKINIIDQANKYFCSEKSITQDIKIIKEKMDWYKIIKFHEWLLNELSKSSVKVIAAYLSGGTTVKKDITSVGSDALKELLLNPNLALKMSMSLYLDGATKEYKSALEIANGRTIIRDYDIAYNYLSHYWNARNQNMLGYAYMDCLQNLDKTTKDDLKEMGKEILKQANSYIKVGEIAVDALNGIEKIDDFTTLMTTKYPKLKIAMESFFTQQYNIKNILSVSGSLSGVNPIIRYSSNLATGKNEPLDSNYKEIDINIPQERWLGIGVACPVELRVYDSENRVTGLMNSEVREEIPNSSYDSEIKTVVISSPNDSYRYEVVGTDEGTYELSVINVEKNDVTELTVTSIPTLANAIHQYSIDWTALSQGKAGVAVQIDANADGVFEKSNTIQPPVARFAYMPEKLAINQTITFDASNSTDDGNITSYEWDFGDETNGTGKITTHSYSLAGNHIVTLTVRDNDEAVNSNSKILTIPVSCEVINPATATVEILSVQSFIILTIATSTPTSITLNWNVLSNDGSVGTATAYDIRYATFTITEDNWNFAMQATDEPAPKPAGGTESFTVTGLQPNTTYCFAIKAKDDVELWSGLSNIESATTFHGTPTYSTTNTSLTISPPTIIVGAENNFSVDVVLSKVPEFDSVGVYLSFDPNMLEVTGLTQGAFPQGGSVLISQFNNGSGTIDYAVGLSQGTTQGTGTVFTIKLKAKSNGTTTMHFGFTPPRNTEIFRDRIGVRLPYTSIVILG